jgi:inorganic pyrophosphatase
MEGFVDSGYWDKLAKIIDENEIVIDRRKGSPHPKYPNMIYPVDYGYIKNTRSMDGNGIDIFYGTGDSHEIDGILCTIDIMKNDSEIKILHACSDAEIEAICGFIECEYMSCLLIRRDKQRPK